MMTTDPASTPQEDIRPKLNAPDPDDGWWWEIKRIDNWPATLRPLPE